MIVLPSGLPRCFFYVDILLREGNLDAFFPEAVGDLIVELAFEHAGAVDILPCPDAQIETHGAVGEFGKKNIRRGIFEHAGVIQCDVQKEFSDRLRVFPV